MKTRILLSIGLSAFVLAGAGGALTVPGMSAFAAKSEDPKHAASAAKAARKAIEKRKADKAVKAAEEAVAYAPTNPEYRALLGQAYLLSGRFVSARQAFADALSLDPANGRAALNLALAQIAGGDWAAARMTLDVNVATIATSDRGLAYALAGDPVKAVDLLSTAVRQPGASPKMRQNLALSLALAGRWAEARAVAAQDMPPEDLDARIMQWATFARPTNAYDQVASLLGVRPIADGGQPAQLALARQPELGVAAAPAPGPAADPVDSFMPGVPANAAQVVAEEGVEVEPAPVQVAANGVRVQFAPRREIVQAIPAAYREASPAPVSAAAPKRRAAVTQVAARAIVPPALAPAKGKYFVQLGAYDSPAVARDAWRRTAQRVPAIGKQVPQGARVATKAGSFYRLSVGGFARADAVSLCRAVRNSGGNCFVRVAAGDQLASWAREAQVAAR